MIYMKNEIIIFTDGASRGNPGEGGWGAVLIYQNSEKKAENIKQKVKEIGGKENNTTNNRMELSAVIGALSYLSESFNLQDSSFKIFSDSSYVINGITKWIHGWKKNGWKTKTKDDVENRDLWASLDALVAGKKIEWKVISGHAGVPGNERCDEIATAFADEKKIDLYDGDLEKYQIRNILFVPEDGGKSGKADSNKNRSKLPAYSYISAINGKIEIHKTWKDCEARVKGKNAKFKKSLSLENEQEIIAEFSVKKDTEISSVSE